MKQKRTLITILIILGSFFTVLSSLLINVATSQNTLILHSPPFVIWVLLGIVTLAGIIVAIFLYHLQTHTNHKETMPESRNRLRMMAKVRTFWINGVLEESLHGAVLIALGLREQRDAVANPWRLILQHQHQMPSLLPSNTHITQVYDSVNGELLILGEPGSGKTTLLLELTRDLLDRAQTDESLSIPVVLNLSSWAVKRQTFTKWLVEELNIKYQVPYKLGQFWVDTDQLTLLLDGLDEVSPDNREACIDAINAYRHGHGLVSIVVCSRSTEYLKQTKRLLLHSAVMVQPLTLSQIEEYFTSAGEKLSTVRRILHRDKVLQELATTPLMLSVITLAYYGTPVKNFLTTDSLITRRRQVFSTYIQRMLSRRQSGTHYTYQQQIYWLSWLAQQLVKHNQTEFYLERMQFDWLPEKLIFKLCPSIILGLIYGLGVGLVYGLYFALIVGPNPIRGLVCGSIAGLLNWFMFVLLNGLIFEIFGNLDTKKMKPEKGTGNPRTSRRQKLIIFLENRLVYGLIFGVLNGLLIGWLGVLNNIFFENLPSGIIYGESLSSGIIFGLVNIILATLNYGILGKLNIQIQPAEVVSWSWESWRRNLVRSSAGGMLIGIFYGVLMGMLYRAWTLQMSIGVATGVILGLIFTFISGLSHEMLNEHNIITPNQGIRNSLRNSVVTGLTSGLISGLGFGLTQGLSSKLHFGIVFGLVFGLSVGMNFFLRSGGTACILHVILRVCLWHAKFTPGNYTRFLDYAVEHILLRRVGGSYIFIHRLLLDYFAALDIESVSNSLLPHSVA